MTVKGVRAGRVVAFGVFNETSGTEEVVLVAEVDTESEERTRADRRRHPPGSHTRLGDRPAPCFTGCAKMADQDIQR